MSLSEGKSLERNALPLPLQTEECWQLNLPAPEIGEIYPYLGYLRDASPRPEIAAHVTKLVVESQPLVDARGSFSIYPVTERKPRSLRLGEVVIRGDIAEFMEGADRVAIFIVTIGEKISERSASLRQSGDAFGGWVVDAFGSWAAEAAADAITKQIEHYLGTGEALTLRYSPGYCGMEMSEQRKLFGLVDANALGVELLPSFLMRPLKSISGLVGIGPKDAIVIRRSACDRCPQLDCHMRR